MIKKYLDFINESLELIFESNVIFSDKFRYVLKKIDNTLSKKILDIENKDINVQSNYFDIAGEKNDTVSFIPDRRAQQILSNKEELYQFTGRDGGWLTHNLEKNGNIFNELGYVPEGEVYKPTESDRGKILKKWTSPTSGRTYAHVQFQNGRSGVYNIERLRLIDETTRQIWTTNRQEIKIGRAIRSLLKSAGSEFTDKDIEIFVNQYKATIDKINDKFSNFEEVKGNDISYWYNEENYYERSGTLGNSCMSSVPQEYFDIYCKNPDKCSLIIYKHPEDAEKIVGRALLWTLPDGKRFMDRIYTIKDSDVQLFRDFAKENGWYSKYSNSSTDSGRSYSPDGSVVDLNLTIYVDKGYYDYYPYLDTLKYYTPSSGKLSNVKENGCYTLEDTSGEYISCSVCYGRGTVECYSCDGRGEIECRRCHGGGERECSNCDGNGSIDCDNCNGEGTVENSDGENISCNSCGGSGSKDCDDCEGSGNVPCSSCEGSGNFECDDCSGRGECDCPSCS